MRHASRLMTLVLGLTLPLPAAADTTSESQYDYVVIGSGAGGGPVAARLAEDGFRVLVLEAGGKVDDYDKAKDKTEAAIYHAPLNHGASTEWRETRWRYFVKHNHLDHLDTKYEPRNSGAADAEPGLLYPRASTLGGCTAHHAMITISAHDSDWNHIAELTGDKSWRAEAMREMQQRVERLSFFGSGGSVIGKTWNRLTTGSSNPGRNGYEGWLPVTRAPLLLLAKDLRLTKSVLETIKLTDDAEKERKLPDKFAWHDWHPNDWRTMHESPTGFIRTPYSANNGMRTGTRERLLDVQARHPDRLCIAYHAFATRLLMKPGRSAGIEAEVTGVEYEEGQALYAASADYQKGRRGITRQVFPKREVIVSCGAFNTPQLLMLSGIGPKDQLERVESARGRAFSPRVIREGVGRNLQDRYEVVLTVEMIDKQGQPKNWSSLKKVTAGQGRAWSAEKEHTITVPHRYPGEDRALAGWMKRPGGINLYATNGASSSFIWKTKTAEKLGKSDPDLFVFSIPGWFRGYSVGWPDETLQQHNWLSWVILKGHTNNTGRVTLNADQPASPFQRPVINFNNFHNGRSDDPDLAAIVEGLEFCHDLMKPAIEAGKARPYWPRPELAPWDAEHFREHALREAWGHHASCTCPIGPDPRTIGKDWEETHGYTPVLDSDFRVHGVSRLRVVDASVFPKIPGFFILMPTYMISEKAAQVISEDASRRDG